jgi:hypothetical protein
MTSPENPAVLASLAIGHLQLAAILALAFAVVTLAYLAAFARRPSRERLRGDLLLHTLFCLWQSNVAYFAVAALISAERQLGAAGELMGGWAFAPLFVPSAAILYTSVIVLSVIYTVQRGAARGA